MKRKLLLTIMFSALVGLSVNAQWQKIGPGGGIVKCYAKGGPNLFAGTSGGGVFLTTDSGAVWSNINNGLTNPDVQALAVTNAGTTVFAGTYGDGVFLSTNSGGSWIAVNTGLPAGAGQQVAAIAIKGTTIFAGTNAGVYRSTNNGTNWTAVNTGLGTTLDVLCLAVSGTEMWAGTGSGGVFLSTNDGGNWTAKNTGLTNTYINALAVNGAKLYLGHNTAVCSSVNNGSTWTVSVTTSALVKSIDVNINGTTIFTAYGTMTSGGIRRSLNNGTAWAIVNTGYPTTKGAHAVFQYGTRVFAGTDGKGAYKSPNNGGTITWASDPGITNTNAQSLSLATSGTNLFAGVFGGGVYLSTSNGAGPWTEVNSGLPSTSIQALVTNGTTAVFAGTNANGVYKSVNNGTTWTAMNTGLGTNLNVTSLAINGTYIYAGTYGGGVFRSLVGGTTWTAVNTGITNLNIISLVAVGTKVFAGTYYGGVFYSNNSGGAWTAVNTGLTNLYINTLAISGSRVYAGTVAGVFTSGDNGSSWVEMNTGLTNLTVMSLFTTGYKMFAGTDGGGVFFSNDSANNWTAVNTNIGHYNVWALAESGAYVFGGTKGGGVWKRPMADFDMSITTQSADVSSCAGNDIYFSVAATGIFITYQWQVSTDGGVSFNNCFDGIEYSGVATPNLTIIGGPSFFNGFKYHCVITSGPSVNSTLATLTINETPDLSIIDPVVCSPSTVDITTTFTDLNFSTGTVTYWTDAGATVSLTNPTSISVGGTYYIKKTAGICTDIKPVNVTISPAPNLSVTNPLAVCSPNTVNITNTFTDLNSSTGTVSYWADAGATISVPTPTAISTGGTYYIQKIVTGICLDIKPVIVVIDLAPNLSITNPPAVCSPSTVNITTMFTDLNFSVGTVTYWTDAGATVSLTNPTSISVGGTYYIKKTTGICTDIKPVNVIISAVPNLSITNPLAVCSPNTIDITNTFTDLNSSTGTISYWANSGATISVPTPTAISTGGTYYIQKTVTGTCLDIKPVIVVIDLAPNLSITNPPALCFPNTVDITLAFTDLNSTTGTVTYWIDSLLTVPLTTPTAVTASGTYYIQKIATNGCKDKESVKVIIRPLPNVSYTQSPLIVCNNGAPLTLSGGTPVGGTYSGTGVTANIFDPSVAGSGNWNIVYTYSDVYSCTDLASQSIFVDVCTSMEAEVGNKESGVTVFPNPFTTSISLTGIENSADLILYNVLGAQVGLWRIINSSVRIDTNNIPSGVYFLQIKTEHGILIKKIIKE